jgi:uncharacterized protein (DUF2147 family)
MKIRLGSVIFLCSAFAALADPVEGLWKTKPDDNGNFGHVQIAPCGPAFCGVLTQAFTADGSVRSSANIGRQIVWDMAAEGAGAYAGGKIWSPDRDKTYSGKMQLDGDGLAVSGCVLGICRDGGTWTRVK